MVYISLETLFALCCPVKGLKEQLCVLQMVGHRIFNTGVELAVREMAQANLQPVRLYEFGFRGDSSISSYMAAGDTTNWGT